MIVPVVVLLKQDAIGPMLERLAVDMPDITAAKVDPHGEFGWTDDALRLGVFLNAMFGAYVEGDLELLRLPQDARGAEDAP